MRLLLGLVIVGYGSCALALGLAHVEAATLELEALTGIHVDRSEPVEVPTAGQGLLEGRAPDSEGARVLETVVLAGQPDALYRFHIENLGHMPICYRVLGTDETREQLRGNASVVRALPTKPTQILIANRGAWNQPLHFESQSVAWALEPLPVHDALEPNNYVTQASALSVGDTWTEALTLGLAGDSRGPDALDQFRVEGMPAGSYLLEVEWNGARRDNVTGADLRAHASDESGATLAAGRGDANAEALVLPLEIDEAGSVTIALALASARYNTDGGAGICVLPYRVRVRTL